jgi:hypothetical protein
MNAKAKEIKEKSSSIFSTEPKILDQLSSYNGSDPDKTFVEFDGSISLSQSTIRIFEEFESNLDVS